MHDAHNKRITITIDINTRRIWIIINVAYFFNLFFNLLSLFLFLSSLFFFFFFLRLNNRDRKRLVEKNRQGSYHLLFLCLSLSFSRVSEA